MGKPLTWAQRWVVPEVKWVTLLKVYSVLNWLKHWINCYDNQVLHWLIDESMQVLDTNMPWGFCGWKFFLSYIYTHIYIKPMMRMRELQVYPVVAVLGTALSLCIFAMGRNLSINPDVRLAFQLPCFDSLLTSKFAIVILVFFITYTWVTTNFLVRLTYIEVLSDAYMHVLNSLFCKTYKIALNNLDVVAHKTLLKTSLSNMIFTWSIGWSLCVYTHIMIDIWMETHFYYYGILTHIKTIWFVNFFYLKHNPP